MKDWKEVIISKLEERAARRVEITTTINTLLSELKASSTKIAAGITEMEEYPLSWEIEILGKKFRITEFEISERQFFTDEWNDPTGEKRALDEILQELLVEKFVRE